MVYPIQTFFEFAQKLTRALVSARKAIGDLRAAAAVARRPTTPSPLPDHGDLVDEQTGFVAHEGQLTIVVSAVPEDTSALADRLGRYLSRRHRARQPGHRRGREGPRGPARPRRARGRARPARRPRRGARPAAVGGDRSAASTSPGPGSPTYAAGSSSATRGSQLFAGTLQDAIDPHGRLDRDQAEEAMRVANAEDVYDALPGGWQGRLDERGRGLSGGQRQRVVLARAIAAEAPVLVLVEPTSAVDAHTEARIAERVADVRRGRTTVVTTVSPLWLHHADRVVLVHDDRAIAARHPRGPAARQPRLPPRGHPRDGRRGGYVRDGG